MDSLWIHYGFLIDSLWIPYGFPMDSLWIPCGFPYGFPMDSHNQSIVNPYVPKWTCQNPTEFANHGKPVVISEIPSFFDILAATLLAAPGSQGTPEALL